jgi:hypothetical protein
MIRPDGALGQPDRTSKHCSETHVINANVACGETKEKY